VIYVRFCTRFVGAAPNPHHWVRFVSHADDWNGSGIANTVSRATAASGSTWT